MIAIEQQAPAGSPVSLRLAAESDEMQRYRVGQVTALATFPDGSERDVSDLVRWSSSEPATLRVNSTGLAVALTVGEAALTACWVDVCGAPLSIAVR
jgi:hypothetical protein